MEDGRLEGNLQRVDGGLVLVSMRGNQRVRGEGNVFFTSVAILAQVRLMGGSMHRGRAPASLAPVWRTSSRLGDGCW